MVLSIIAVLVGLLSFLPYAQSSTETAEKCWGKPAHPKHHEHPTYDPFPYHEVPARRCDSWQVYQGGEATSFQNMAFRQNGSMILTSIDECSISSLNPHNGELTTIIRPIDFPRDTFSGQPNALWGIEEAWKLDKFYFIGNNYTRIPGSGGGIVEPGTNAIYTVDFNSPSIDDLGGWAWKTKKVITIAEAGHLRDILFVNETYLFVSDSVKGCVWGVTIKPGHLGYQVALADPKMLPVPDKYGVSNGISGMYWWHKHVVGHSYRTLFWNNPQQRIFAALNLDKKLQPRDKWYLDDGRLSNSIVVYRPPKNATWGGKFSLSAFGNWYMAGGKSNSLMELAITDEHHPRTGRPSQVQFRDKGWSDLNVIRGWLNDTTTAQPMSTAWGITRHDRGILYVATAGGMDWPVWIDGDQRLPGAQVIAVDMRSCYAGKRLLRGVRGMNPEVNVHSNGGRDLPFHWPDCGPECEAAGRVWFLETIE